jgi:hypothetical protein
VITRVQRAWVALLLVLLLVPGVVGFDVWPLTGWRLFSLSRDADQTEWALDVQGADDAARFEEVDLERLPLAFRNAGWPLAELGHEGESRRQDVCEALLVGVRMVIPDARRLAIVRERRHMRVVDGDPVIDEHRERIHTCD